MKWYELLLQSHADYICSDVFDVEDLRFREYAEYIRDLVAANVIAGMPREKQEHVLTHSAPDRATNYRAFLSGCDEKPVDFGKLLREGQLPIEQLSPQQLAAKIIYPFCSRMGGSFEVEFAKTGQLKEHLLALEQALAGKEGSACKR